MGAGSTHGAGSRGSMNDANSGSGSTHRMTIDQQLSNNKKLSSKIQTLTGMPAQQACDGFKNLGQCVALHTSARIWESASSGMKSDMTGQAPPSGSNCPTGTGTKSLSLGKTVQTLDPAANSKTEAKKGTQQADQDIKSNS
jgi:hypothetical protein